MSLVPVSSVDYCARMHSSVATRSFGENLRRHRLRAGLSQEVLGLRASLHPTEISRLERGAREPRLETLMQVARALDVTPAALLEGLE